MEKKKRLYFLIIPAVCIYIAAVTFVIVGSASRNPIEQRKLTNKLSLPLLLIKTKKQTWNILNL